jgi:hypothetical protein
MLEFARVAKAGVALAATITAGALIAAAGERAMAQPPAEAAAPPAAEPVAFDGDACVISVIESLQQHTRGERNGWRDLVDAGERFDAWQERDDEEAVEFFHWEPQTLWTAPDSAEAGNVRRCMPAIEKSGVFDALERLASSPRVVLELGEGQASDALGAFVSGAMRRFSHLAMARFVIAAEREDWNTATASLRIALVVSRSTQQQAMGVSVLVGRGQQGVGAPGISDALTHVLRTRRVPAPVLERMLAAWTEQQIAIPPEVVVRVETCFGKGHLASMFITGGPRDGFVSFTKVFEARKAFIGAWPAELAPPGASAAWIDRPMFGRLLLPFLEFSSWFFVTRAEVFAALDARAARAGQWLNQPPYLRTTTFDDNLEWQQMGLRGWPIRLALEPGSFFGDAWTRALVERDHLFEATRLILAVELHRARTGALPADLAALVPGELASLPTDPMSGQPYRYRVVPPGVDDPAGLGFVVYGVGADLIDDGGRPLPPELRGTTNRNDHAGFDVVYGVPWPAPKP